MSGYTRNGVYSYVRTKVLAEFPSANCTSRYVPKPSVFPSCYIREIDRIRTVENIQLDFDDVQHESNFEVQVATNKTGTASSEAYAVMDVVRSAFNDLYYRQFAETSIDDGGRFTVIARFRRIIGGGDQMPND